ncbi:hypothetical protein [Streptomyces sp. RTd22]|uniref:hypothetical protein n=1 Tax=Streptomyces sp. RTd22 TaxID=1841249 RepID=UPI0007C4379F|nr:hypothetical protein [Streptomyces sp. RTd22]
MRPGQDTPAALLAAAAVSTVRRRPGLRPAPARPATSRHRARRPARHLAPPLAGAIRPGPIGKAAAPPVLTRC